MSANIYLLDPTAPEDPSSVYSFRYELNGVEVTYSLDWKQRQAGWYLSIHKSAGVALLLGQRLQVGWPVLWRRRNAGLPAGHLVLIDTSGGMVQPTTHETLGFQHRLIWADDGAFNVLVTERGWAPYRIEVTPP